MIFKTFYTLFQNFIAQGLQTLRYKVLDSFYFPKLKKREFSLGFLYLIFVLFLASCANPLAPTGGPRDTTPPKMDSLLSSKNFITKFQKQDISLTFNEWVKLDDIANQVIISPPLKEKPEITLKGKSVVVKFPEKEELRPNATYTINFGDAVKDLTEGNIVKNLKYVFSTGDYIDSLVVSAKLVDAITKQPIENGLFMLYDNLADSVVRKERPFYFAKTGKDGLAQISNVRAGQFKAFALVDGNLNYMYDQENEKIAFPESSLNVERNTPTLRLGLFEAKKKLKITDKNVNQYGFTKVVLNRKPDDIKIEIKPQNLNFYQEINKDTLKIWYQPTADTTWQLAIKTPYTKDSLAIKMPKKENFKGKLQTIPSNLSKIKKLHNPSQSFPILFNFPLESVDTALVKLYEDSTKTIVTPKIALDKEHKRQLNIQYNWKEGKNYDIEIQKNAIKSWYGLSNMDSIRQTISVMPLKSFGDILLSVENLSPNFSYIIQLISNEDEIVATYKVQQSSTFKQQFRTLLVAPYKVTIIEDANGNGRWDTGNYDEKRLPEVIFTQNLEELRANWELEANVIFQKN